MCRLNYPTKQTQCSYYDYCLYDCHKDCRIGNGHTGVARKSKLKGWRKSPTHKKGEQIVAFKKVNNNPKGRKTGDCVIRAIANAENKSWYEVFDALTTIARENATVVNSKEAYGEYLSRYKTVGVMYDTAGGRKRLKPADFKRKGLTGTYVVSLANHLTCVKNGVVEDIWDCSNKSAYKIWKIN